MHPLLTTINRRFFALCLVLVALGTCVRVAEAQRLRQDLTSRSFQVGDLERTALLAVPVGQRARPNPAADPAKKDAAGDGSAKEATPAPLVFVFHGHGGNPRNVARSFAIHEHWPEAVVVYPAGLPTPGRLTDPEGKKPGWQPGLGAEGDRDLAFFDVMYASLTREFTIDRSRVYVTGHSNGGQFTYLLWEARHELLAAVAPSAAGTGRVRSLKPLPAMHLAGEKDTLVRFEMQSRVMEAIREVNGCEKVSVPWAEKEHPDQSRFIKRYNSPGGTPVVTYIHPGGHEFIRESAQLIVAFFREFSQKAGAQPAARSDGTQPSIEPIRAFYIGHSLNSDIPDMVKELGDGVPLFSFREQFIPGAPLRWQWDERTRNAGKPAKVEPQHRGEFQGVWYECFPKGDLTALVMIDSVPRGPAEMPETKEYAGRFITEFHRSNPKGRVYLYEPWHCVQSGTEAGCAYDTSSPTRTLAWAARLEKDRAMWDELRASLIKEFPTVPITLIPAGRALARLAEAIKRGELDGFANVEAIFDDDIHLNPYGKYFVACVHYATLTGRSPEGSARMIKNRWGGSYWDYPNWQGKQWPPPSAKAVVTMQRIAWTVVEEERKAGRL